MRLWNNTEFNSYKLYIVYKMYFNKWYTSFIIPIYLIPLPYLIKMLINNF